MASGAGFARKCIEHTIDCICCWPQATRRCFSDFHDHPGRLISSGVVKNYRAADRFPRFSTARVGVSNESKDETAGTRLGAKWQRSLWPQEEPYASDLGAQIIFSRAMSVRRDGVFDHLGGITFSLASLARDTADIQTRSARDIAGVRGAHAFDGGRALAMR